MILKDDLMSDEMDRAIKSNFYGLSKPFVVLLVVEPKDYQESIVSLMKFLMQKENMDPVYITVNKSCVKLDEIFRTNSLNTDNVFYIDAISKNSNEIVADNERVKYISSPTSLSSIIDKITAFTNKPKKGMVFIVDNVSSFLVYNKPDDISKLLHFIYGRTELTNTSAVFIALKEDTLPKTIGQYADRIIELKYVY